LFQKLEPEFIDTLRKKYAGQQVVEPKSPSKSKNAKSIENADKPKSDNAVSVSGVVVVPVNKSRYAVNISFIVYCHKTFFIFVGRRNR